MPTPTANGADRIGARSAASAAARRGRRPRAPESTRAATMLWVGLAVGATALGATPPEIGGRWRLDPEASDRPEQVIRRAAERVHEVLLPDARISGLSDSQQSRQRRLAGRALFRPLIWPQETLELVVRPKRALLIYDGERRRTLSLGKGGSMVDGRGGDVHIAGFEGAALVVETTSNRGSRIIERFTPTADERLRLEVTVRNRLFDEPVTFDLRFHRPPPSPGAG